jgi:hypothetical protein
MHATTVLLLETSVYVVRDEELQRREMGQLMSWVLQGRLWRKNLNAWAEESPLLEAVTRERLVKTRQAGKGLVGAAVISELWRLAVAL